MPYEPITSGAIHGTGFDTGQRWRVFLQKCSAHTRFAIVMQRGDGAPGANIKVVSDILKRRRLHPHPCTCESR